MASRQVGTKDEKVPQCTSSKAGVQQAAPELETGITSSCVRYQATAGTMCTLCDTDLETISGRKKKRRNNHESQFLRLFKHEAMRLTRREVPDDDSRGKEMGVEKAKGPAQGG